VGRAWWRWILRTMGLWSDESVGTARGLEMVHLWRERCQGHLERSCAGNECGGSGSC
jgi:hypothetical protein